MWFGNMCSQGMCLVQKGVLFRNKWSLEIYVDWDCVIQKGMQCWKVCWTGLCALQGCVQSRNVCSQVMCAVQECMLSRNLRSPERFAVQQCM